MTAALIVAAGRGTRAGQGEAPKQYRLLAGAPVLAHSLRAFAAHPAISIVQPVICPDDKALYEAAAAPFGARVAAPVPGGATRQQSVLRGLEALSRHQPERVLIHDAARPLVEADMIDRVLCKLDVCPGAIAALPVADTLKRAAGELIAGTLDRSGLWQAQTPQGFHFAAILDSHRRAAAAGREDMTDDAGLAEWAGIDVALVTGSARNLKLTTAEDFALAERLMAAPAPLTETRTGLGFDVHRFMPGDHVWLCGVRIPHTQALEGHSDADAGLHALTDALLGAIGDGDIGQHFPPTDPRWKDAPSRLFLADAAARLRARSGRIVSVDVTLVCEAPKIGPYREAMREAIGAILGLDTARIGVKATTSEGLGFTGRREGIAAMAVASVTLPVR